MKIFFRRIHLYLGLAAGLVVMVTCFTGAVLVFEEELQQQFNHERYYVTPADKRLPLETLVKNVQKAEPKATVNRVKVFEDGTRSVVISYRGGKKSQAFVNPYTGKVIELYSYRDTFYYTMFSLHRYLLSGDIGKMIVGVCTLIFLFILITGIILWWPKNKRLLKQRLKIKWNAGWKRINHDWHIVLGFYTAIFLFIFAFTGLAWSFEWFNKGIYSVTNSSMERPKAPQSNWQPGHTVITVDAAYETAREYFNDVEYISISLPSDSADAISIAALSNDAVHSSASDVIYIDQYTGKKKGQLFFAERNPGSRIRSAFKPVHTGSIYGMSSKIIALIACLCGTTFPVTGVILWLNRIRKKPKKEYAIVKRMEKVTA